MNIPLKETPGVTFNPKDREIDRNFGQEGDPKPDFVWCVNCNRTYRRGLFRLVGEYRMCPYEKCRGDAVLGAWPWTSVRRDSEVYPEEPEEYVIYQ